MTEVNIVIKIEVSKDREHCGNCQFVKNDLRHSFCTIFQKKIGNKRLPECLNSDFMTILSTLFNPPPVDDHEKSN